MKLVLGLGFGAGHSLPAATSFSPPALSGLSLWLDAADTSTIIQVSGSVLQWNDKSTNAHNAVQPLTSRQPQTGARSMNGRNVLDFASGGLDSMELPGGLYNFPASDFSFFVVAQSDSYGAYNRLIGSQSAFSIVAEQGSDRWCLYNKGSFSTPASISPRNTQPHIFYFDKSGAALRAVRGGVMGTGGAGAAVSVSNLPIGSSTFDPFDGAIAEIILYGRALAPTEINQIGNYLSDKWGIAWTNL